MVVKVSKITEVGPPKTFVSIDASTNSLAFALYSNNKIVKYGKIKFEGKNINQKVQDIALRTNSFFSTLPLDSVVVIEDTIFTNSPNTAAQLSKAHGALLAGAFISGVKNVYVVSPIAWQSYIGTRLLSQTEKDQIRKNFPDKSAAWYKSKERNIRKHLTMDTINKAFGLNIDDDDIADACGIALYASNNWGKLVNAKSNKV